MLLNIFVLGLAAIATALPAAMPIEAELEIRDTITNGGCSTVDQRCYLPGGSPSYPCDQQSGKCTKTNNVCSFSSSNIPGSGPFATGKAHCT